LSPAPPPLPQRVADGGDDDDSGRSSSQFLTHLKKKNEANSEFSRTKTIAQQRRALPVYQVRDELLQVGEAGAIGGPRAGAGAGARARAGERPACLRARARRPPRPCAARLWAASLPGARCGGAASRSKP
jgi:hypothetical protein